MTIGKLKQLLEGVDDSMVVMIPVTQEFDGMFYSPCEAESGVTSFGISDEPLTEEDIKEMELLNKSVPEEDSFLLIPCRFHEEKDHSHELN